MRAAVLGFVAILSACTAPEAPAPPVHRVLTNTPSTDLLHPSGSFDPPSLEYAPIAVAAKFRHVLNFEMSPMMPPSLRAKPTFGPLILYSDDLDVIVFSPLDSFFTTWVQFDGSSIRSGLSGEVSEIPPDFQHRFVMVEGHGINTTVQAWGELVRARHGVPPVDRYADDGLGYLGYWTDNGAYYYYRTEEGLNEEDTLLAVKEDADSRKLPYRYFQLDSWWYHKAAGEGANPYGGVTDWTPIPSMFPEGLAEFRRKLGLPLILHNRWFAPENVYSDRFEFVEGVRMALPKTQGVFGELMAQAASWGAITYEQDWLMPQFDGLPILRSTMGAGEEWMRAIDDAASARGLTTQLTMGGAAHLMDATRRRAVTSIRTSIDYKAEGSKAGFWPQFHTVNMVAAALGLIPFKDNFQSSEKWGEAEALVSSMSAGMVGIGDRAGAAKRDILLKTCREDGMLLKPDRPATPIDGMFLPHQRPYITSTGSRHEAFEWKYVAAYQIERGDENRRQTDDLFTLLQYDGTPLEDMFVIPDRIQDREVSLAGDLGLEGPRVIWSKEKGASLVEESFVLPETSSAFDHTLVIVAPVFDNDLALIGETSKFVTVADKRFEHISTTDDTIELGLLGAPSEEVEVSAFDADTGKLFTASATVDSTGRATLTLTRPGS